MDIDFPLVLSWAVLISGTIWLVDVLFFKPRRVRAVALREQAGAAAEEQARLLAEPRVVEYARSFFPVLLLVLVVRSFLAEPYQIPSESMLPTLEVGDFILVNKYAYGLRLPVIGTKIVAIGAPQRGDIMVFVPPHDPRYFIKRVVGVPGDHIRIENNVLYINGVRAQYEYVQQLQADLALASRPLLIREYRETLGAGPHRILRYPFSEPPMEWRVPEGGYFMLGDNRGRSEDSRVWGFVPEGNIVGKAVAIWVHKEPGFKLPTFARNQWLD
jgi:signal peptidase I